MSLGAIEDIVVGFREAHARLSLLHALGELMDASAEPNADHQMHTSMAGQGNAE